MAATMRKLLALAASAALLFTLVAAMPGDTSAANLTGGTYTYVVEGEEATFTVDPINRKDGLLFPAEVFQTFNITLESTKNRTITLQRNNVRAEVKLGTTLFQLNGKNELSSTAPMRLNGRVFLPADLLRHFGVEYTLDGNYVTLRDLTAGLSILRSLGGQAEWDTLKTDRSFKIATKLDSNVYADAEYILLTPDLIGSSYLDISYGTRVKLQQMQQTNTLVLVSLANNSFKSGTLTTASMFLLDSQRRQSEVTQVMDIGQGMLNSKLAPGANRMGVLVYPKVAAAGTVSLYHDGHSAVLGSFFKQ